MYLCTDEMENVQTALFGALNAGEVEPIDEERQVQVWRVIHRW